MSHDPHPGRSQPLADAQIIPHKKDSRLSGSPRIQPQGWWVPGHNHLLAVMDKVCRGLVGHTSNPVRRLTQPLLSECQVLVVDYSKRS